MTFTLPDLLSGNVTWLGTGEKGLSGGIVSAINEIAGLPGVEKVAMLPDIHLKEKYLRAEEKITVPSSSVIITHPDTLYPQFRSRGIGCGMILVATGIILENRRWDIGRLLENLSRFLVNREVDNRLRKQGFRKTFAMSPEDMVQMGLNGAPWVCKQFGLSPETLQGFFRNGSFFSNDEAADFPRDGFAPEWIDGTRRDGRKLGLDLGGNHFLEAQKVQDVPASKDPKWLKKGELVFLYHGSCNGLSSILRSDLTRKLVERPEYACFSSRDWAYEMVFRAVKFLLNWSAAARCIVLARLNSLLSTSFPNVSLDGLRCVSEAPHNSILAEGVGGAPRVVYRHNAVPIEAGHPVIVSGRYDHLSYLFLPGPSPERSVNTLDHGVGAILGRNSFESISTIPGKSCRIERQYLRNRPIWHRKRVFPLIDPTITEPLFRESYQQAGLVEPECYRLRPIVTLKRRAIPLQNFLRLKWK